MPLVSALNGDNRNITPGSPVAGKFNRLQLDRVVKAGASVLAAGIVTSGAPVGGVIVLKTDGIVDLDDWSLATGKQHLESGLTYRLSGIIGKLTTAGTRQVIGLAVSKTQLSLQITNPGTNTNSTEAISQQLDLEIENRTSADLALSGGIVNETTDRTAADVLLQNQITELQQPTYARSLLLGV